MGRKLVAILITAALVSPSFVSAKPPPKFNKPPPEHIQKVGGPKDRKVPKELLRFRGIEAEENMGRKLDEATKDFLILRIMTLASSVKSLIVRAHRCGIKVEPNIDPLIIVEHKRGILLPK